jgi:fatty acid-binding protein DegV
MNDSLLYAIAFSQMHGINLYERKKLINVFGSAISIYYACQQGGKAFVDLELKCIDSLMAAWPLKAAAEELSSMKRLGIDATCIEDCFNVKTRQHSSFQKVPKNGTCPI